MRHAPARALRRVAGAATLAGVALGAASCSGSTGALSTTTTTVARPPPAVVAYVTRIGSGTSIGLGTSVLPWNLTTGAAGAGKAIEVGTFPAALALAPSGKTLYVANYASGTVTPIDLATGKAGHPIAAGNGPAGIAITPDGRKAYVTDAGVAGLADTVTPIDLATGKPEAPITVGSGPEGIAITPDGSRAYVADSGAVVSGQAGPIGHTVTPIDLTTGKALAPITVGNAPGAVAVSPDGATVLVTNANSGSVTPISVASDAAGAAIAVPGAPDALAMSASTAYVAVGPSGVARGDVVVPITLATGKTGTPIPVGKGPSAIALTADGRSAWVVCYGSGTLEAIDLASGGHGPTLRVAGGPYALALTSQAQGTQRARPKR